MDLKDPRSIFKIRLSSSLQYECDNNGIPNDCAVCLGYVAMKAPGRLMQIRYTRQSAPPLRYGPSSGR
jgi:hypothetical protein